MNISQRLCGTLPSQWIIALVVLCCSSCVPREQVVTDYQANFDALWRIIEERYCFLDEKGVDWDEIYQKYQPRVRHTEGDVAFFGLLSEMLDELRDGHVNLISPFDVSGNTEWLGDATEGLNIYARNRVLGPGLMRSGGMRYGVFSRSDRREVQFGYISYGSFNNGLGNMPFIFKYFSNCSALILDMRGNGGGSVENSDQLVSYFVSERTLVGYSQHKLSPRRGDFSEPKALYIAPSTGASWTSRPVIVLQDRGCYSATNDFLYKVDAAPNVIRIGLPSGGGAGLPASSELPNGWRVRYSAVKNYDRHMKYMEAGIAPDIEVSNESYTTNPSAPDSILLSAINYILEHVAPPKDE